MISEAEFHAYKEAFPGQHIVLDMACDAAVIDENAKLHPIPYEEDTTAFYDRIKRSKECGRNLFFEELSRSEEHTSELQSRI